MPRRQHNRPARGPAGRGQPSSRPHLPQPTKLPAARAFVRHAARALPRGFPLSLLAVTVLPVLLNGGLWAEVWRGADSQAWDGSGHHALARVYSETVFPDTFGWTHAYFAGMGFPNFYPPLSYWLIALLQHTGLVPPEAAFKLVLVLPTLLLPAALWLLAWRLSGKNRLAATCAAVAAVPLLVDYRLTNSLGTMGLSYTSTFLLGLYTQTLGFVLLVVWYVVFTSERFSRQAWRPAVAAVLLALVLLANFFGATVAAILALTTLAYDAARLRRADTPEGKREAVTDLLARALSPLAGLCLTFFWLTPLANSSAYIVTRPQHIALGDLIPAPLWLWYALAAAGAFLWLRRPSRAPVAFLAACALLVGAVLFASALGPRWFPLQPQRLASTLNFLLAAPVGHALANALGRLGFGAEGRGEVAAGRAQPRGLLRVQDAVSTLFLLALGALLLFGLITPPDFKVAFYDEAERARVAPVLEFARERRDGRYLVENQPFSDTEAAHDGRAINACLGRQGNASLALFFREGAPNVLFLNPLADAFSAQPDSYGISSVLADDTDFARQPLASHVARARFFGVKYLIVRGEAIKARLAVERDVAARHDFGRWSVFELAGTPPHARALAYRPALVVGDLTLKLRRENDYGFLRLAEEQFASGWFDVLLARAPESRLDRLEVPQEFGALVVDAYRYDDAEQAYERLRVFARGRQLILLSADDPLFRRIQGALAEFPRAEIIDRAAEAPGAWLESDRPTKSYGRSSVRAVWNQLRQSLDRGKTPTGVASDTRAAGVLGQNLVGFDVEPPPDAGRVPLLIDTTFHPNWRREDGGEVYATTPFFMLTFADRPGRLVFARTRTDKAGACVSALTLLLLPLFVAWRYRAKVPGRASNRPRT